MRQAGVKDCVCVGGNNMRQAGVKDCVCVGGGGSMRQAGVKNSGGGVRGEQHETGWG